MTTGAGLRLLAFDTSTEQMSVAVGRHGPDGDWREATHVAAGGAAASRTLLPTVLHLLGQIGIERYALDAVAFGCGPGAFTGLRTACAVAQGLSFGALGSPRRREIPVLPVDTLTLLAEGARHRLGLGAGLRVMALLDARMDEVYSAVFRFDGRRWGPLAAPALGRPQDVVLPSGGVDLLAGNVFEIHRERLPADCRALPQESLLPDASALLRLAPALLADGLAVGAAEAQPLYIRDKVAQTEAERAAARAAAADGPDRATPPR